MGSIIRSIIIYIVVMAVIIGVFKLLKMYKQVTIDPNDHSISEIEFPNGSYSLHTEARQATDYKSGENGSVVAYYVPGKPGEQHVARVVALPGEKVAVERRLAADPMSPLLVKVNGVVSPLFKTDTVEFHFPDIVVPRGCLFLMADRTTEGTDSLKMGPVPFYCIRGRLR